MKQITIFDITNELGPIQINWGFERKEAVKTRNRRVRVKVEVWVKKKEVDPNYRGNGSVTMIGWGTAPMSEDQAVQKAETNAIGGCLMWLGFLPDFAKEVGISEITDVLGPMGPVWDFEEKETVRRGGKIVTNVLFSAKKKEVSLDGKGRGYVEHEATGEASSSDPYAEDKALVTAIRNAAAYMMLVEDEPVSEGTVEAVPASSAKSGFWSSIKPKTWGLAACMTMIAAFVIM